MVNDTKILKKSRKRRPARTRPHGESDKSWHAEFLRLVETHAVCDVVKRIGISRAVVYAHREKFPDFAEAWDQTNVTYRQKLERSVKDRALKGTLKPIFFQGRKVATVREWDNNLSLKVLEKLSPEVWGEKSEVTVNGQVKVEISVEQRRQTLAMVWPKLFSELAPTGTLPQALALEIEAQPVEEPQETK